MRILSQPAFGPKHAIAFITGGVLLDIWILVWRNTLGPESLSNTEQFWYSGLLLTGLSLLVIGVFLCLIGRSARRATLPFIEKTPHAEERFSAPSAVVSGQTSPEPVSTVPTPFTPPTGTTIPGRA